MVKEGASCTNSFGIASVLLGILSVTFSVGVILGFGVGLILGILSLIFAIVQFKKGKNGWAITGLVLSIIGILANIVVIWWILTLILELLKQVEELQASGLLSQIPVNFTA